MHRKFRFMKTGKKTLKPIKNFYNIHSFISITINIAKVEIHEKCDFTAEKKRRINGGIPFGWAIYTLFFFPLPSFDSSADIENICCCCCCRYCERAHIAR